MSEYIPKLKVGDVLEVHGWVMLEKLEDGGFYKVQKIRKRHGKTVYYFCKPKGFKTVVGHYAHSVDSSIRDEGHGDLNKITLIRREADTLA